MKAEKSSSLFLYDAIQRSATIKYIFFHYSDLGFTIRFADTSNGVYDLNIVSNYSKYKFKFKMGKWVDTTYTEIWSVT